MVLEHLKEQPQSIEPGIHPVLLDMEPKIAHIGSIKCGEPDKLKDGGIKISWWPDLQLGNLFLFCQ